jgi:hypothetical protein
MVAPRDAGADDRADVPICELAPRAPELPPKYPPRPLADDREAGGGAATRDEAEGTERTCLSTAVLRARALTEATVDEPLAAVAEEVIADEVAADEVDAAELAFTLLFTKR